MVASAQVLPHLVQRRSPNPLLEPYPRDLPVDARSLLAIFDSVYVIALTSWFGSILFFSFGVAPIIFQALSPESAARFVRTLFPRYYLWGAISGAIALPASLGGPLTHNELRGPGVAVQAFAILGGILVMLYCGNTLTPQINAARDQGPAGKPRFDALHRRSVQLNSLVLLMGLGLLIAFAVRARPTSGGIIEMNPVERVNYDQAFLNTMTQELATELGQPVPDGLMPLLPSDSPARQEIREMLAEQRVRNAKRIEAIRAEKARATAKAEGSGSTGP